MVYGTGETSSSKNKKITESGKDDRTNNSKSNGKVKVSALIVDDDPIVRTINKMLLSKSGFKTQAVEDGKQAIDLFHSGAHYDIILMDFDMPVMDGLETTRELRAMGVASTIIGLTSRHLNSEKQAFMRAGLNDCHEKPLKAEVVTSLHQVLMNKN